MWVFCTILKNWPLWFCMSFPGKQKYRQVQRGLYQQVSYTVLLRVNQQEEYTVGCISTCNNALLGIGVHKKAQGEKKNNKFLPSQILLLPLKPSVHNSCWFLNSLEFFAVFFSSYFWELWLFRKLLKVLRLLLFLLRLNFSITLKCLGFSSHCLTKDNLSCFFFFSLQSQLEAYWYRLCLFHGGKTWKYSHRVTFACYVVNHIEAQIGLLRALAWAALETVNISCVYLNLFAFGILNFKTSLFLKPINYIQFESYFEQSRQLLIWDIILNCLWKWI